MKETSRITYLLRRHIKGKLTLDEKKELEDWSNHNPAYRKLLDESSEPKALLEQLAEFEKIYGEDSEAVIRRMQQRIKEQIDVPSAVRRPPLQLWRWSRYAATVTAFLIAGLAIWKIGTMPSVQEKEEETVAVSDDVAPGGQKAVLTLADGRQISLREDQDAIVLGGEGIRYVDGSTVLSGSEDEILGTHNRFMSVSVPKGGVYQVVLSDGTKVWLNSSSELRYPERFADSKRIVELTGEAYFEVSSVERNGRRSPFMVKTRYQEIEVLGTQFNVSAYHDQSEIMTTLVEGSVAVSLNNKKTDSFLLSPGYQSTVSSADRSIRKVDVGQYIAWKDGLFYFKNTSFEDMIRQISRWYNVDVVYKGKVPNETFTGKMSRSLSLMTVLELLNVSNVNVQVKGEKLIVN